MGSIFRPKAPSGPSPQEIQAREQAARQAERDRIAQEEAASKAQKQQEAEASLAQKESRRQAFVSGLDDETDENERKRFLKGA